MHAACGLSLGSIPLRRSCPSWEAWARPNKAVCPRYAPPLANMPPPALTVLRHPVCVRSGSHLDLPRRPIATQDASQAQALLQVVAEMKDRLEKAEGAIEQLSADRDRLQAHLRVMVRQH